MIADQFSHLSQYCQGAGLEFGEDDSHASSGVQVRTNRRSISGLHVWTSAPWDVAVKEQSQDFILSVHYLEHYSDIDKILKHWWGLLKPQGNLILVLPEAGKYPRVGEPKCNPDHRVDFNLASLPTLLQGYGFQFEEMKSGLQDDNLYLVVKKTGNAVVPPKQTVVPPVQTYDGPLLEYSVVIPFYNKWTMTKRCVDSLLEVANPAEIILVDDGSTENKQYDSRVKIVRLERNNGFPFAVNRGVEEAKCEFVVLLNNDVTMQAGGVEKLLRPLRDPSVGMTGQDGGRLDPVTFEHKGKTDDNPDYLEMFCVAFRKTVWEKVGPLDLDFGRGYSEDADWGIRARKSGYNLIAVGKCCDHKEAATHGKGDEVLALIERNRKILLRKHHRGTCCWVMASLGVNGGGKVALKLMAAMQDDGWLVDVCSMRPWSEAVVGWEGFGHKTPADVGEYDMVVSTFQSTMPVATGIKCKYWIALIQSDEPEWPDNARDKQLAKANFMLPGFKHVIIADHMREFTKKYNMKIVGQIQNGVDSLTFHPTWLFEREWPHTLLRVRKNSRVWYDGSDYADEAMTRLAQKYGDLKVIALGGDKSTWPCQFEHVKTFDEAEINKLYNRVSCVVIPSLIEGCSLVPLEAMASETPVVSTSVGMEYAVDEQSYLQVPFKDSKAIVQAVSRIFDEPELRQRLVRNALQIAHQRTWENEQNAWLQIINREIKA